MKYSSNKKLNAVLNNIESQMLESLSRDEIRRYYEGFKNVVFNEPDYNIAAYGNLLIYYDDIKTMYRNAGYKSTDNMSNGKIWNIYRRQVGYVARSILNEWH